MRDRLMFNSPDDHDALDRSARSTVPQRARGSQKSTKSSGRDAAKRAKRKSVTGGIHQRRNKRADW
jgi:hypothetical protein